MFMDICIFLDIINIEYLSIEIQRLTHFKYKQMSIFQLLIG